MEKRIKRILVVDDDSNIRRSLARVLRLHGLEVVEAADGNAAVRCAVESKPDLLLLDIRMPGIDGVATFCKVREALPMIPAVFMTAYASSERADAATLAGAIRVLPKPLNLEDTLDIISESLATAPVLIVDDHDDFLRSLARSFDSVGIPTVTVGSLENAVAEIRKRPDRVVIADVFLQDGKGLELLSECGCEEDRPPLILVTGHSDWFSNSATLNDLRKLDIVCLAKPLDMDELVTRVQQLRSTRSAG